MQELLDWLEYIEDDRQQRKVRHTLKDILVIVLFATLANAMTEWKWHCLWKVIRIICANILS